MLGGGELDAGTIERRSQLEGAVEQRIADAAAPMRGRHDERGDAQDS